MVEPKSGFPYMAVNDSACPQGDKRFSLAALSGIDKARQDELGVEFLIGYGGFLFFPADEQRFLPIRGHRPCVAKAQCAQKTFGVIYLFVLQPILNTPVVG